MRKTVQTIGCLLIGFVGFSQGGNSSFSLQQAKEYALANSDKIKNATLDLEIAVQKVKETRGIGLPQINASGSFNDFINQPVMVMPANFVNPAASPDEVISIRTGTKYNSSANIQATQLVFSGSYIVALQVSKFYTKFSETSIAKTKEEVLFNVIQAYQTYVIAKSNKAFIDSLVVMTSSLVDKQRNFLELGMMTQEDMDQLDFALLTAKNNLVGASLQVKNAESLLKLTMGYPQNQSIDVSETIETLRLKNDASTSSFSIQNNINYQLLTNQKVLNEYALKEKKYSSLPTLNAVLQQGYNAYRNDFDFFGKGAWYQQTFWGLQLQVPIFSSGVQKASVNRLKSEIVKNENAIHEFEQTITFQEAQAQNNLQSAKEQLTLQEQNVALAKKIYDNAIVKEQIGKGTSIIVSQKYNQLIEAQAHYINAVLTLFNAELQLEQLHNNINK